MPATEAEADPERTRIRRMVRLDSIERQEVARQNASVCACVHIYMHVYVQGDAISLESYFS